MLFRFLPLSSEFIRGTNSDISPNRLKLPNSLYGAKDQCIGKVEGLEDVAYVLTICMNVQSDETSTKSRADTSKYAK